MVEKDFSVYELYSVYGKMLTETQARAVEDYFGLDLSLGEIAENRKISRQAVKDAVSCAEKQLFALEKNLGFYSKINKIRAIKDESALSSAESRTISRVLDILEE